MIRNNQGLTVTYNRFHDPEEDDSDILKLRQLHTQMDAAVLTAYGWTDISTICEFRLDYEEADAYALGGALPYALRSPQRALHQEEPSDTQPTEGKRQRKKPWRYRWPEVTHDEVLARLLELNQQRHGAEILGGKHAQKKAKNEFSIPGTLKPSPNASVDDLIQFVADNISESGYKNKSASEADFQINKIS